MNEGVFVAVFAGLILASLGIWSAAIWQWRREGFILPFAPRRPVPWGPIGLVTAICLCGMTVLGFLTSESGVIDNEFTAEDFVVSSMTWSAISVLFVVTALVWLVGVNNADRQDLGLPTTLEDGAADVAMGITGCLAALAPVLLLQALVVSLFGEPSSHPVLEMLQKEPTGVVMLAASFSAAVVAPVFEELVFRQLLQGWLQQREDLAIHFQPRRSAPVTSPTAAAASTWPGEIADTDDDEGNPYRSPAAAAQAPLDATPAESPSPPEPPRRGLWGLPYGTVPLLISSILFSLAHLGHGPDPIPLFVLALVLGYLYQRTHRILPCIVLHMLFNSFSLALVWFQTGGEG